MSDRNLSTDASKDIGEKAVANYTLELEVSSGVGQPFVKLVNVSNYSLRSGFMVVEYAGGEQWFRASDIVRLTKSYM